MALCYRLGGNVFFAVGYNTKRLMPDWVAHKLENRFATDGCGHGLARCELLLLTERTRFYLYSRGADGQWPDRPMGYFNTGKLRLKHVLHSGTNPIDSILALSPARLVRA